MNTSVSSVNANPKVRSRSKLKWISENKENLFDVSFMSENDKCNFATFGHSGSLDRS